ncbi:response regulator [Gymnodinialimonas sp. 2305UL16-5]|uniref:response regulator n=1 Tax=Gymnodinialimonas mytili TaxID=3126503 RepID=UPI0030A07317
MTHPTRVLVLEDQLLLAFALKAMLGENDIETVGPFANAQSALAALDEEEFHFALLDVNLGDGETSTPVADALLIREKPFVFVTGYGSAAPLPPRFDHVDRFLKPVNVQRLLAAINQTSAGVQS